MKIVLDTVPHAGQRYETVGDWITDGRGHLRHVRVSEMGEEDYHFLVAIHELVEAWLCIKRGVDPTAVDEFDKAFEAARQPGDDREPGHEPDAPYHKEHVFAEKIERQVADELGVDWEKYEQAVMAL